MGHAWRPSHNTLPVPPGDPPPSVSTACPAPGAPLPPPDPAVWWLALPSGPPPPRAPLTVRAPGYPAVWWLAPPGSPPRAPVTMCPAPLGDPPPPRALLLLLLILVAPPASPDAATRWRYLLDPDGWCLVCLVDVVRIQCLVDAMRIQCLVALVNGTADEVMSMTCWDLLDFCYYGES
jgi:hypothetical protein